MDSMETHETARQGFNQPMRSGVNRDSALAVRLPMLFLAGRLMLLISLPLEGLRGYGDFVHFFHLAAMGWPFVDYWVEFPPVFPFLSSLLFRLSGGRQQAYDILLALLLSLAQAGSLAIFVRLSQRMHAGETARRRSLVYFVLLLALPYGWWYFDPLAVLATLLALEWLLDSHDELAGLALAIGGLIKLFPLIGLALAWRLRSAREALLLTLLALGLPLAIYGMLYLASPQLTIASLRSQASKGSWETSWALLDGNFNTGNFGPESERFDPAAATLPTGNPARISPWLALVPFAVLGGWFFKRTRITTEEPEASARRAAAFLGLAWALFLLWSPGWSPQWVLYLLPLILLTLPERVSVLMSLAFVFINLLEWPVLLSRGLFWGLWLTIPVRTCLFILLIVALVDSIKTIHEFDLRQILKWKLSL